MSASKPKPSFNSGHGGSGGAQVQYDYNNNTSTSEKNNYYVRHSSFNGDATRFLMTCHFTLFSACFSVYFSRK